MCSIGEVEGKNDEKTDKEEIKLRKESFLVALTAEVLIGHSGAPKIDWGGGLLKLSLWYNSLFAGYTVHPSLMPPISC